MTAYPAVFLSFFEVSRTVNSMCVAGVALIVIAALAVRNDFALARGLEKIITLANFSFAVPLAMFGALHLAAAWGISTMVPSFVPWHLFWAYFVGVALLAASLSMATKIKVVWSGLLFGLMMFIFVATMDVPGVLSDLHNRISWTLMLRELSFGCGGGLLAAAAISTPQKTGVKTLVMLGRIVLGITAVFYGVEHFLHPINAPGVPLEKIVPEWIPGRALVGYLTGAILLVAGACILLRRKTRMAAGYLGAWLLLLVLAVYGPILIVSLMDPSTDVKVEGLNYFGDTLLFAGTILALAQAIPQED